MSKHCKGCKREITWGQKDCPFCGTSQSFVRQYFFHLIGLFMLLAVSGWLGSVYIHGSIADLRTEVGNEYLAQLNTERETVENLNQQMTQLQEQLKATENELQELKSQQSSSLNDIQASNEALQQQLLTAEQSAERQKGRADWLGKENVRLKAEIEGLKQQLTELQQRQQQLPQAQTTLPVLSLDEDNPENQDDSGDGQ